MLEDHPAGPLEAEGAAALGHGLLARNTAWMTVGQGSRVFLGAAYFVVIARALHADGLGAFAGAVALVALAAPFASLGAGNLLIKHVARDPRHFRRYWGGALSTTIISGVVLGLVVMAGAHLVLPTTIPFEVIGCVVGADLLFSRILDISGQAYQAHERLARTAQFPLLISVLRLFAAGAFTVIGDPTPGRWALWYLGSSAVSAIISVVITWRELGRPANVIGYPVRELREGMYFATSLSAQNIYNDIDKSMLARLSTLEATGIYSAAYRLIDVSFVPVRSLLAAAYPRFFQQGVRGVRASLKVAVQLLPVATSYATVAGVALFLAAPILPRLLGADYQASVEATRLLAILPLLKSVHYFAADTLTGAGYQGRRTVAQVIVAAVNIGINIPLIAHASWRGAAWSSIASDGLLAVMLWTIVWATCRHEDQNPTRADATVGAAATRAAS
jgi:O-antigen/teichoic acid export membrane protein